MGMYHTSGIIWRDHLGNLSLLEILQMMTLGVGAASDACNRFLWCCAPVRIRQVDIVFGPVDWYVPGRP